jgi:ABC-2 type transport system permease protein
VSAESVIHDIGYQRYQGPRLGRGYALRSLYTHSVRTAFGFGRPAKSKVFPWSVIGIVFLVATVLTAIRSQTGTVTLSYWEFPRPLVLLPILFCAVVAPELVSRDLRGHVLPLYFSRPLNRSDYALAKLAALVTALWLLLVGPETLMLLGGVFTVDGMSAVWSEVVQYGKGLASAAVYAIVFGTISLLVASLAGRRAVAAAMVAATFLVAVPVYGVLTALAAVRSGGSEEAIRATQQWAGLINPATLAGGVPRWWFDPDRPLGSYGPLYGVVSVALAALCVLLLLLRYRKVAR